jgi:hypothetical protein
MGFEARPAVLHFGGYRVGEIHTQYLKIINVSGIPCQNLPKCGLVLTPLLIISLHCFRFIKETSHCQPNNL